MEGANCGSHPLVDFWQLGNRYGLPPAAHPSRLQNAEVAGVFLDYLWNGGARGGADLLGSNPPHPPSILRQGRRPAFADRRQMVGAYGMDSHGQEPSPGYEDALPLCS